MKTITLKSKYDELVEVDEVIASESRMLKNMIEDGCADGMIPLLDVTGKVLSQVIEYCKRHVESKAICTEDEAKAKEEDTKMKEFDADFVKLDIHALRDLIQAAHYLDIKGLLDLTCQAMADKIKDMSVENIRKVFGLENDLSPVEEEEIRREHQWAFQ